MKNNKTAVEYFKLFEEGNLEGLSKVDATKELISIPPCSRAIAFGFVKHNTFQGNI